MNLPTDTEAQPPPRKLPSLADLPPPVTAAQRETDFNRVFTWRSQQIAITLINELYYRDLRVHMNAPPLGSFQTMGDFATEATRIIYCAHLSLDTIRVLRLQPPVNQIKLFDDWVAQHISFAELEAAAVLAQDMQDVITRSRSQPAEGSDIDGAGN